MAFVTGDVVELLTTGVIYKVREVCGCSICRMADSMNAWPPALYLDDGSQEGMCVEQWDVRLVSAASTPAGAANVGGVVSPLDGSTTTQYSKGKQKMANKGLTNNQANVLSRIEQLGLANRVFGGDLRLVELRKPGKQTVAFGLEDSSNTLVAIILSKDDPNADYEVRALGGFDVGAEGDYDA